jgi:hypothetical protein
VNQISKFRKSLSKKYDVKIKPLDVQIRQLKAATIKSADSAVTKLLASRNVEEGEKIKTEFLYCLQKLQALMNAAGDIYRFINFEAFESFNIFIRVAFRRYYSAEIANWLFASSSCNEDFKAKISTIRGKYKVWRRCKDLI